MYACIVLFLSLLARPEQQEVRNFLLEAASILHSGSTCQEVIHKEVVGDGIGGGEMGGGMERGKGVKDLSGQIGRALNPEGQSIHSAIHYPAIGVTHHESVKVLFPRVQENFPKHFRNVCGHSSVQNYWRTSVNDQSFLHFDRAR